MEKNSNRNRSAAEMAGLTILIFPGKWTQIKADRILRKMKTYNVGLKVASDPFLK
jgi:hypothetical protein